jgi:hypothetical protein
MPAKHHTTLPRCDCIGTLRGFYEDPPMRNNPLGFRTKRGKKSPSRYRVLAKPNSLLERVYTPSTPPHLSVSGKVATTLKSLVIQPRQSHVPCGCTVFLGWGSQFLFLWSWSFHFLVPCYKLQMLETNKFQSSSELNQMLFCCTTLMILKGGNTNFSVCGLGHFIFQYPVANRDFWKLLSFNPAMNSIGGCLLHYCDDFAIVQTFCFLQSPTTKRSQRFNRHLRD